MCRTVWLAGCWGCRCRGCTSGARGPRHPREVRRGRLAGEVGGVFHASGGTYGSARIWISLVREGWRVSVNTIAEIMAELGLAGRAARRRRSLTRPGKRAAAPDFVRCDFTANAPDQVWCGDLPEVGTGEGRLCLATVIDLFSRRLLGYAMGERHDADLVVAALHMAAATRGGEVRGVIFHSDRGSEPGSRRFRRACRHLGVPQSMGRVGSCFDNALSEAFNSVLKVEYVHRHTFVTRTEARLKIATWITGLLQRTSTTQPVGIPKPDRPRTSPPSQPRSGAGRIEDLHSSRGLTLTESEAMDSKAGARRVIPVPQAQRRDHRAIAIAIAAAGFWWVRSWRTRRRSAIRPVPPPGCDRRPWWRSAG
jgi:putative transposase